MSETRGYLDGLAVARAAAKPKAKPKAEVKTGKVEIKAKSSTKKEKS